MPKVLLEALGWEVCVTPLRAAPPPLPRHPRGAPRARSPGPSVGHRAQPALSCLYPTLLVLAPGDTSPPEVVGPRGQSRPSPGRGALPAAAASLTEPPRPAACSPHSGETSLSPFTAAQHRSHRLTSHAGSHDLRRPCRPPRLPACPPTRSPITSPKWRNV